MCNVALFNRLLIVFSIHKWDDSRSTLLRHWVNPAFFGADTKQSGPVRRPVSFFCHTRRDWSDDERLHIRFQTICRVGAGVAFGRGGAGAGGGGLGVPDDVAGAGPGRGRLAGDLAGGRAPGFAGVLARTATGVPERAPGQGRVRGELVLSATGKPGAATGQGGAGMAHARGRVGLPDRGQGSAGHVPGKFGRAAHGDVPGRGGGHPGRGWLELPV